MKTNTYKHFINNENNADNSYDAIIRPYYNQDAYYIVYFTTHPNRKEGLDLSTQHSLVKLT